MEFENCLYRLFKIYEMIGGFRSKEKLCIFFPVTRPSLQKSTNPKPFFARNYRRSTCQVSKNLFTKFSSFFLQN